MHQQRSPTTILLALVGSALMFAGWAMVILATFQQRRGIWPVILAAVVASTIILVPSGLDIARPPGPAGPDEKRGLDTLLMSMLPAAWLFLGAIVVLPLRVPYRLASAIAEFAGMTAFGWARRTARNRQGWARRPHIPGTPAPRPRRSASPWTW